jgi:hypothetical protein
MLNVFIYTNVALYSCHRAKHPIYFIIHKFRIQWNGTTWFFLNAMFRRSPLRIFMYFFFFATYSEYWENCSWKSDKLRRIATIIFIFSLIIFFLCWCRGGINFITSDYHLLRSLSIVECGVKGKNIEVDEDKHFCIIYLDVFRWKYLSVSISIEYFCVKKCLFICKLLTTIFDCSLNFAKYEEKNYETSWGFFFKSNVKLY